MSYITLGNLTRFLNKLKGYLDNNYLKKTLDKAGIIYVDDLRMRPQDKNLYSESGHISFRDGTNENLMDLYAKEDVRLGRILTLDDHQEGEQVILSSNNFMKYAPSLTGTGATGLWNINISGNAYCDSEGHKITDTYVKKSDILTGSAPDLTKYMKKSADSSLDMKEYPIYFGGAQISVDDGFAIDGTGDKVKIKGTSLFFNNSRIDTREDNQKLYAPQISPTFTGTVTAPNVTVTTSLAIPGGKIWIA